MLQIANKGVHHSLGLFIYIDKQPLMSVEHQMPRQNNWPRSQKLEQEESDGRRGWRKEESHSSSLFQFKMFCLAVTTSLSVLTRAGQGISVVQSPVTRPLITEQRPDIDCWGLMGTRDTRWKHPTDFLSGWSNLINLLSMYQFSIALFIIPLLFWPDSYLWNSYLTFDSNFEPRLGFTADTRCTDIKIPRMIMGWPIGESFHHD